MAELLEMAQLSHQYGMTQVEIGGRRVEPGLDAQRRAGLPRLFKASAEVVFVFRTKQRDDLRGAFGEERELFFYRCKGWHVSLEYKDGMPDKIRKRETETPKKEKICKACGRAFGWRKKWEKDWDVVKYCSDRCRGNQPDEADAALEAAILELLAERGREKTICPSEAAKRVGGREARHDWEALMEPARAAARRLVAAGRVVITQRGRVVDGSTAKGPIRLKLR